jgi:hypothetical protein
MRALPNRGRANYLADDFAAVVSPSYGRKSEGMTKLLEGRRNLGFQPNECLHPESTPKYWFGSCWLQSKRTLNLSRC